MNFSASSRGQLKALETQLFLADLAHLGLELLEHLGRERLGRLSKS